MLKIKSSFSSFSVDDMEKARAFYEKTLGISVRENKEMGLNLELPGGKVFIYQKDNHEPATFTVLNIVVQNIDKAVQKLKEEGVEFEMYEGLHQDKDGIARGRKADMGPDMAWFKDPSGNILSIIQSGDE